MGKVVMDAKDCLLKLTEGLLHEREDNNIIEYKDGTVGYHIDGIEYKGVQK